MNKKIMYGVIVVLVLIGVYWMMTSSNNIGVVGSAHEHADFKVYINGGVLDFAKLEYMVASRHVHIEDMNGEEIHKHATGITLGYFFDSLDYEFDEKCFVLDSGVEYCNGDDKMLRFYVNGVLNEEFGDYEIRDDDEYLISYGDDSEDEIQGQLGSVGG